jgi:hypothetical protein
MQQHSKYTWLSWDEDLVYKHDESKGNTVFKYVADEDSDDLDFDRGYILISSDREVYVEDSETFAVEFDDNSPFDREEIGIYDEHGQLLINVQHH